MVLAGSTQAQSKERSWAKQTGFECPRANGQLALSGLGKAQV